VSRADAPLSAGEAKTLFADLARVPALVLAVSGGPDSTALLMLAARWRAALKNGPQLLAVTVDHGLRAQSAAEASAVKRLARQLGVPHKTLRWTGRKPVTGLQEAAREARYRLLAQAAKKTGAQHVVTAHNLDDQAETVMLRLVRGSGLSGLCAMARESSCPALGRASTSSVMNRGKDVDGRDKPGHDIKLIRPFLDLPKARLIATLRKARLAFADDPSNRDPRFTRARLRALMPELAKEGLSPPLLARLARRLRRADLAIEAMVWAAAQRLASRMPSAQPAIALDAAAFARLPDEVALRLLGRAVAAIGDEGPVELGKLEALYEVLAANESRSAVIRRTLAGAVVTHGPDRLFIERAPPRGRRRRAEFRP
jgi:tRNA(Ile)-lysidine synthase